MYEYKVVPAPRRGLKGKGVKGADGKFAYALEVTMNDLAKDGWEYIRADTLPSEEREGLMGKTTVFQNVLVFRRAVVSEDETGIEAPPPPLLEDKSADEDLAEGDDNAVEDNPETAEVVEFTSPRGDTEKEHSS